MYTLVPLAPFATVWRMLLKLIKFAGSTIPLVTSPPVPGEAEGATLAPGSGIGTLVLREIPTNFLLYFAK